MIKTNRKSFLVKATHLPIHQLPCKTRLFSAIAASLLMSATGVSFAQDSGEASANSLEVIVVTAQRRAQNLQDVPVAISAFSEESISRGDLDSVGKLEGQVPGLVVSVDVSRSNVSLRGIGSGLPTAAAEAGVPINIDGVYMTRTTLQGAVFGDLQQIEVLRGPQGTLYGRNATGGTVNVWSKVPDGEFSGDFSTMQGNNGRSRVRGRLAFPMGDTLSARVGVEHDVLDGHIYNITLDEKADPEEHLSARGVVRWAPSDKAEVLLRADVSEDEVGTLFTQYLETQGTTTNPLTSIPANPPFLPVAYVAGQSSDDPLNIRNNIRSRVDFRDQVFSLTASYDMDWATFKSVTAYQEHGMETSRIDTDGTSGDYSYQVIDEESDAWTQEFTLSGGNDRIDWVVGSWYMEDDLESLLNVSTTIFFPAPPVFGHARADLFFEYYQKTESLAFFGQTTYNVTDRFRVTAGARYSKEDKTVRQNVAAFGPPQTGVDEFGFTEISPKFSVDFDVTDDMMFYVSVSEGLKAGGVNVSQIGSPYDPEILLSYETGVKSDWADGRFQANLNAYYYDFQGFQGTSLVGIQSITSNAADAEVTGLEAELSLAVTDSFTLKSNLAWADSEFGDFISPNAFGPPGTTNLKGNDLPFQAEYTGNVSALYEVPMGNGSMTFNADYSFTTSYFLSIGNEDWSKQDGYGRTNARASYAYEGGSLEGLEFAVFVNNIEDELVRTVTRGSNTAGGVVGAFGDPRTYGVEARYRF